jgi:hypothetical protein
LAPERFYELSDVIFIGRVTSIDRNRPLDQAVHVTFDVYKSWKGVDTEVVTIRTGNGNSCGYFRFEQGHEYLVYGDKDISSINVGLCGGTADIEYTPFVVNRDLKFLENSHTQLELKAGYTTSVNLYPIMTIVGSLVGISAVTFVVLVKRL